MYCKRSFLFYIGISVRNLYKIKQESQKNLPSKQKISKDIAEPTPNRRADLKFWGSPPNFAKTVLKAHSGWA